MGDADEEEPDGDDEGKPGPTIITLSLSVGSSNSAKRA